MISRDEQVDSLGGLRPCRRTACGGPPTQRWTDQEVIKTFKDQIQTKLELDPKRSDEEASVLVDPSDTEGYYTVWVFKSGYSPINYDIGDVPVPPHGVLTWGQWEALAESSPGDGVRNVMRTYGNVVLSYYVDQEKGGAPRPQLPKEFIRVDSALSALDGFTGGTVTESMKVKENSS
jgi:hypothetical protein